MPSALLKSRNRLPKLGFISAATLALVWINLGRPMPPGSFEQITAPTWVLSAVMALITAVVGAVDAFPGTHAKAVFVFWRLRHPLPGTRAFTAENIKSDPRIDKARLLDAVGGAFPRAPAEQNAAWYRLYKSVESDVRVEMTQAEYLLYRDLTWFAILFTALGLMSEGVNALARHAALYFAGLHSLMFILFSGAARERGIRFVNTVLAQSCATDRKRATKASKRTAS